MPVSEPSKYTTLWSQGGIRFDIPPAADPVTGKAGFDVGFSSINMASEAAGGIPPWGQDFNGILFSITRAIQYIQSGALPTFSSDFSTAISGYKKGAVLIGVDGVTVWQSEIDGNTTDPDSPSAAGWVNLPLKYLPKRSFTGTDSIRIPDVDGGLILKWGSSLCTNVGVTNVIFPEPFPNAVLQVIGIGTQANVSLQAYACVSAKNISGFTWSAFTAISGAPPSQATQFGAVGINYLAIGF